MPNHTHTPRPTDWSHAGDPSAAILMPPTLAREYVKLSGSATGATLDTIERAGYWFRDNFGAPFRPVIRIDPANPWFIELVWPMSRTVPDAATRNYAKGVLVGLLVASGHDVV